MMPVIHQQLNPDLWSGDKLKSEVRNHLLLIAESFYKTLKIEEKPEDITLTGSSANYNYTSKSDIDLHILIPFKKVTCDEDLTKDYFLAKKSVWNNEHNITLFKREVELYVQDSEEPHVSTGVFSVLKEEWVIKPEPIKSEEIKIDEDLINKKYNEFVDIINHNINKDSNYDYLKKIKARISEERKEGLSKHGEFSTENIVFKNLRSNGYLDKLSNFLLKVQDKKFSMESFKTFFQGSLQ